MATVFNATKNFDFGGRTFKTGEQYVLYDEVFINELRTTIANTGTGFGTFSASATNDTSIGNIDTDIGAPNDSAASSDTGTFSLIALIKRGLQNWTTFFANVFTSGGVNTLPRLGNPKKISVTSSSTPVQLTAGTKYLSIYATSCNQRYLLGGGSVVASNSTSHFIAAGERLEFAINSASETYIAAISDGGIGSGRLEISELT